MLSAHLRTRCQPVLNAQIRKCLKVPVGREQCGIHLARKCREQDVDLRQSAAAAAQLIKRFGIEAGKRSLQRLDADLAHELLQNPQIVITVSCTTQAGSELTEYRDARSNSIPRTMKLVYALAHVPKIVVRCAQLQSHFAPRVLLGQFVGLREEAL